MSNKENKAKIEQLKKSIKKGSKIAGKIGKKILTIGGKTLVKTAKYNEKKAQILYNKYNKLNKKAKTKLHRGLFAIAGIAGLAGGLYLNRDIFSDSLPPSVRSSDANAEKIKSELTKTYKITDKESFRQLYEDALPLIQASLIPIEIYKEKGYYDGADGKKKKSNTIGLGLWWFPIDGNPNNPHWVHTSYYLNSHPNTKLSFEEALVFTDAWFRIRDRDQNEHTKVKPGKKVTNTVYNRMYSAFKGSEINLHQFAACASCIVNSESGGLEFCKYYAQNRNDPVACARYLVGLKPKDSRYDDGIMVRHAGEACMFMYPEYAAAIYSFKLKDDINSLGKAYTTTSVNQTTPEQCKKVLNDLNRNSTAQLSKHRDCIMKYICKGEHYTVADMANMIKDEQARSNFLRYYSGENTISFENAKAELTYADALKEYEAGNYEKALASFQQLRANGYDGADLRNDIAITHYKLGHYQECIEECRAVLNTGEEHLHPAANYNAGKAYEALGNYERAYLNYEHALVSAQKNGANDTLKNVYKNAMKRIQDSMKNTNPQPKSIAPQKKSQKTISKTSPKAQKTAKTSTKSKGKKKTPVQNKRMKPSKRGR